MQDNELSGRGRDDPALDLLCELIRRRSVTPEDAGCLELIASRLEPAGFHCEPMPFGEVSNLWARRGTGRPLFCFAGHSDVVPPGPPENWSSDPFEPETRDGRLYGRGAADMKSGLAAMVTAALQFVAAHPRHRGSIAFLLTSDEEGRAREGTKKVVEALSERDEIIDWCVLGEPSSREQLGDTVRIGRRGSLSAAVTVRGVQGHVAYPEQVDNPIRRFAPFLKELHDTVWDEGNDFFPPTSFQVVSIASDGGAPNVTPALLKARFNFRYSTVWTSETLKRRVEQLLGSYDLDCSLDWHLSGEPFLTEPGPLTEAVVRAVYETSGVRPELSTGGGTSDGRFISPAGAAVVELGPVNSTIHKPDENVPVADVAALTAMYRRIMELLLL